MTMEKVKRGWGGERAVIPSVEKGRTPSFIAFRDAYFAKAEEEDKE